MIILWSSCLGTSNISEQYASLGRKDRTNGSHSYATIQKTLYKKVGGKNYTVKIKV